MTDRVRKRVEEMKKRLSEEREANEREMESYFDSERKRIEKDNVERNQHGVDFIDSLFTIK